MEKTLAFIGTEAVSRTYKDGVFRLLFKDREKLIELYNAVAGTDYDSSVNLQIETLENALFLSEKNDLAFTINNRFIILMEHQATINFNMPLRMFFYLARTYEKLIPNKGLLYRRKAVKIPMPELYVFYNGSEEFPSEEIMRLSDSYECMEGEHWLELKARIINVNLEKSSEVLQASKTLREYSILVYKIRQNLCLGMTLGEAVELAVSDCVKEDVLKEFLEQEGSQVRDLLCGDFTEEERNQIYRDDGYDEGVEQGAEQNRREICIRMIENGMEDPLIMELTEISAEGINRIRLDLENAK